MLKSQIRCWQYIRKVYNQFPLWCSVMEGVIYKLQAVGMFYHNGYLVLLCEGLLPVNIKLNREGDIAANNLDCYYRVLPASVD